MKLSSYEAEEPRSQSASVSTNDSKLKLPELKCPVFDGEGATQLQYHAFITSFNNIVGCRKNITDSIKLTYLKSYLSGYAAKVVQHLQVNDENYRTVLNLLDSEFQNIPNLIDDLFKKLLKSSPSFDTTFHKVKEYVSEIRALISDLKIYKLDFLSDGPGNKLLSHIVIKKMPLPFQTELVRKLGSNYPTLNQIFDNYVDIVRILNLRNDKTAYNSTVKPSRGKSFVQPIVNLSTTSDKRVKDIRGPYCRFCIVQGHSMTQCKRYSTLAERRKRCVELQLCVHCSSAKHPSSACGKNLDFNCNQCNSKEHITPLCDKDNRSSINYCVNANKTGGTFLLPIVGVELSVGKVKTRVRCILDTASQQTFFSKSVFDRLNVNLNRKVDLIVNTFISDGKQPFFESTVNLALDRNKFDLPVLVSETFNLKLKIDGLAQ